MSKAKDHKPSKAHHVFPAPEWTSLSSAMAAALAHEIRNPLLAIKGAAQLLEQTVGAEDQSLARLIVSEVQRIEALVATMDPLTPDPQRVDAALNIHEVTEYVRLAARSFAGGVEIHTQYDPSLPAVRGAQASLVQALINLVKNAVEAVEGVAQPSVTIATRYLIGERMQRPDGTRLPIQVSVTDNGPGVAEALVPRLFTPFNSSKVHGEGLGLAIVARIIAEHGGLIAYDAPSDGGARFSIYLPVAV